MRKVLCLVTLILGFLGSQLIAAEGASKPDPKGGARKARRVRRRPVDPERMALAALKRLDRNKDGKISKEEWGKRPARIFQNLDTNGDGVIDAAEAQAGAKKTVEMTRERAKRIFNFLDSDKDGKLSLEEFERYAVNREIAQWLRSASQPGGPQRARPDRRNFFKALDKNGDGKISKDEWRGREERFKQLDKNGDGYLTPDELRRGRSGGRRGGRKKKSDS